MNLNLLISKYVDGDLTVEEDQLLRRLLSEQPAAKEAFDAATVLHFTMLEDADSIEMPHDFLLETEAKITMKFAVQEAITKAKLAEERARAFRSKVSRFGSVTVALLLICTVPFSDMFLGGTALFSANEVLVNDEAQVFNSYSEAIRGSSNQTKRRVRSNRMQTMLVSDNKVTSGFDEEAIVSNSIDANRSEQSLDAASSRQSIASNLAMPFSKSELNSSSASSVPPTSTGQLPLKSRGSLPLQFSLGTRTSEPLRTETVDASSYEKTEIQVSTFVANNVANSRDNSTSATAVSQSIAYSLGESSRIGVEIGYRGYTYQGGGTVLVPRGTATVVSKSKTLGMDGFDGGLPIDDVISPTAERASLSHIEGYDEKKVEYAIDKTMYWGAAFYEHVFYNSGKISVNGRVGAGGSNDGAMAFSRAFARYDVVKGVALTLGAEANAFMVNLPMVEGKHSEVNSGVSLVYGMQIKF